MRVRHGAELRGWVFSFEGLFDLRTGDVRSWFLFRGEKEVKSFGIVRMCIDTASPGENLD